ncbi:MAG: hypothetical protein KJ648_07645 [Candidatus Omnitrophica bacterium]|nr:hypothetical protein [Candidatus Omnitrophota bacterium]
MFSMVDRLERMDISSSRMSRPRLLLAATNSSTSCPPVSGRPGHRYTLVCENCGAESAPFFILPAGAIEGTVTGEVGQVIEMDKLELERLPEADQQPITRSAT